MRHRALFGMAMLSAALGLLAASRKEDLVRWRSIREGEREARSTGKPALYFFTAEWCSPCHTLRREVFSDPKTAALIEREYVPISVEDREQEEGRNSAEMLRLARRFGLQGFPTLIVARPDGKVGVQVQGWAGRERSVEFLNGAKERLLQMEREEAKSASR